MQKMYLEKDSEYFKFLSAFKERYSDFDVIFMNPGVDLVHPEYLIKISQMPSRFCTLSMIPMPLILTDFHTHGLLMQPHIYFFYSEDYSMEEILNLVGFKNTKPVSIMLE